MYNLKIAIVTLYNPFEKIRGGIESVVYNLSKYMVKMGIETWILTMGNVKKETITKKDGINLWIIPDKGYKGLFVRSLLFIKYGRKAIKILNEKYHVNIFNGQAGHSAPLAFIGNKYGRTILTAHTLDRENFADMKDTWRLKIYKRLFIEIIKYPFIKIWRILYLLKSDNIIFVSKSILTEFEIFYPFMHKKRNIIIENGSPDINRTLRHAKKEYDFVYSGRIDTRKGVDLIIKAASLLRKDGKKFNIIIVGDGSLRNNCEKLTKMLNMGAIIKFTGYIKAYDDLFKYISRSRFLIFPSFYESDPLVIKESLQIGVPIIASNILSSRGKILDKKNGYLFEKGNYHDLYRKMAMALTVDEESYNRLSRMAEKSVKGNTWEDAVKIYVRYYSELITNVQ